MRRTIRTHVSSRAVSGRVILFIVCYLSCLSCTAMTRHSSTGSLLYVRQKAQFHSIEAAR